MCGIVGFIGNGKQDYLDRMVSQLTHRGPDSKGIFMDTDMDVYLGHRRLEVIDVSGGSQPMTVSNNKRYRVCGFRAEISVLGPNGEENVNQTHTSSAAIPNSRGTAIPNSGGAGGRRPTGNGGLGGRSPPMEGKLSIFFM